jgi:transposase
MEIQDNLNRYDETKKFENMAQLLKLSPNKNALFEEKKNFIETLSIFIDSIDFGIKENITGRPSSDLKDIIKSLLIMAYHGMSYRRAMCDINELKEKGIIHVVPSKTTLNRYACSKELAKTLSHLIQASSLFFIKYENTVIMDSTWLATRMYIGGHERVYDKENTPFKYCRKLHIACLRNSRVIAYAKVTSGTTNDNPLFQELLMKVLRNGFDIRAVLADAGYNSKDNYAFCDSLNINRVFIDFKSNSSFNRAKSKNWKIQLKMFKEEPEKWKSDYRFRVIVEGIFSAIKRKQTNYLRARIENSREAELLLKCLVYNLTIIAKNF